jgi:hypothetical protein
VGLVGDDSRWARERHSNSFLERQVGLETALLCGCGWKWLSDNLNGGEALAPTRCAGAWLGALSASSSPVMSMRSIRAAPATFNYHFEKLLEVNMKIFVASILGGFLKIA